MNQDIQSKRGIRPVFGALLSALIVFSAGCASTGGAGGSADGGAETDAAKRNAVKVTQTSRGAQITSDERILFETGKFDVKSDGSVFLDRVAAILKGKTTANVSIEGHTDNIGSAPSNQLLSERRAAEVQAALVARGVAANRITSVGLGMTKPVADNATPDGRQANRRTEILVLGETVENIGGASLGERLGEGISKFLSNVGGFFGSVFGGKKDAPKE
jgi:outer membrane protein OmpA-like peptidoglycan-associated protein